MPLDPLSAKIERLMSAAFPDVGAGITDAGTARRFLADAAAEATEPEQIPVAAVADGAVGDGPPVRIYRPDAVDPRGLPVVLFFHGGGFVLCGLDSHDRLCRALCSGADALVVSVDYRLAPEHPFPAAADDAMAALRWVRAEAAALGGDPERIAVAGDSAGGNLAAVTSLRARDTGFPAPVLQLLLYPTTDHAQDTPSHVEHAEGGFLTAAAARWFWGQYLADPAHGTDPYASPLRAPDLSGLPPACVITAECDPLRDEGEAYAVRLADAGTAVSAHRMDGTFHGFVMADHILPSARDALDIACTSLREAFADV